MPYKKITINKVVVCMIKNEGKEENGDLKGDEEGKEREEVL